MSPSDVPAKPAVDLRRFWNIRGARNGTDGFITVACFNVCVLETSKALCRKEGCSTQNMSPKHQVRRGEKQFCWFLITHPRVQMHSPVSAEYQVGITERQTDITLPAYPEPASDRQSQTVVIKAGGIQVYTQAAKKACPSSSHHGREEQAEGRGVGQH